MRRRPATAAAVAFRRAAVTLVELLAALGCLSILFAILSPAVMRARDSARAASCTNNLRQLGVASAALVSTTGRFPQYVRWSNGPRGSPPPPYHRMSGHVDMLPYLDQAALMARIDPDGRGEVMAEPPYVRGGGEDRERVPVFICPADDGGLNNYRACFGVSSSLLARSPDGPRTNRKYWAGVFHTGRPERVLDGASSTALFSERVAGDRDYLNYEPFRDIYAAGDSPLSPDETLQLCQSQSSGQPARHYSFAGASWLWADLAHTKYNHIAGPNSEIPDCLCEWQLYDMGQGAVGARSLHPGFVNVCLVDGAVRRVADAVDLQVWRALGTADGGEVISDGSW